MARVSKVARRCEGCSHRPRGRRTLAHVLTCSRNVYAYRWLCSRCRAGRRAETHAERTSVTWQP